MGEGWERVNAAKRTVMTKKHPPSNALDRARSLRRDMTEAEMKLWALLREIDGFKFRRQAPIGLYIVDFVCHAATLIIEADGGQHDLESDREVPRTEFLEREGYRVLRFWNNEVLSNLEGVHTVISAALGEISPSPNPPPSRGKA
jgi:very-short-patch-repair endonuclease